MSKKLLAIDQGTTSSRALVFAEDGAIIGQGQHEFDQHFPSDGWVEHQPEDIWKTTKLAIDDALSQAELSADEICAAGITNQRETTVVWDRLSGEPIYPAIVWQDRRTASSCETLRELGHEPQVRALTGLLLDAYFSATKLAWILDNVDGARARAEAGELAFGTVDTFLIWRLTQGRVHATDATNASRTLLFDIHRQCWSDELLTLFNIPASLLPEVKDSAADFGSIAAEHFGHAIPICGVAGDQQAALIGQACFSPGEAKSTYGTGCFIMVNTGDVVVQSQHRLLATVAYRLAGKPCYALEGSIFIAGAVVQWLRDGLRAIPNAAASGDIALAQGGDAHGVYLVPAFTGLGAPHWDPHARGGILGLTRDNTLEDIVVAGLQAVVYQSRDLMEAIKADGISLSSLKVDGGMSNNDWLMQFLADQLAVLVRRPDVTETTALGAAILAGLGSGIFSDLTSVGQSWQEQKRFQSQMDESRRDELYQGWLQALGRIMH
ncbi:MAG: glycerol kinase GlpK [Pseudomonadales bacterium]